MGFEVDIGVASRRGAGAVNEDALAVARAPQPAAGLVAAVADGVGASGEGAQAAQTVVRALLADAFDVPATWSSGVMFERLLSALNAWLCEHNRRRLHRGGRSALTTLTALALRGHTWSMAHVGDSRAWLLRQRSGRDAPLQGMAELHPLSQDHVIEGAGVHAGLTRAIGLDDAVRVDHLDGEILVGDRFVLTSDGVHAVLPARRLAELVAQGSAQQAADALVEAAAAAGGGDDASAIVLHVRALDLRQLDDELADARRLPVPGPLRPGDRLDGYRITACVADSGVARVLQARDEASGALVAIKTLSTGRAQDPHERAMLAHEAWLGRRLGGLAAASDRVLAGFVRLHPRQADAGALYLVFDWHSGQTMAQRIAQGQRPTVAEVIDAALALTRALGRLHRLGVVHRDIKPANLHLGDDGRWRVLDLGHALSGREGASQRELHAGTPSYMNPEQWRGAQADAGSDLFALGVALHQWLTARLPFGEIEPYARAAHRRDAPAASKLRPDVPIWFDRLLAKAIAHDASQRFETAEEMALALERGAARGLPALPATPLLQRHGGPTLARAALALSLLLNLLLVLWLLFLPR